MTGKGSVQLGCYAKPLKLKSIRKARESPKSVVVAAYPEAYAVMVIGSWVVWSGGCKEKVLGSGRSILAAWKNAAGMLG